jgi:hypothetical protein
MWRCLRLFCCRIQIGAHAINDFAVEVNDPAVAVVEAKAIASGGERVKFDNRVVAQTARRAWNIAHV